MESAYRSLFFASSRVNVATPIHRGLFWKCRSCRTMSTTKILQAVKPSKTTSKGQRKPLEYKTPTRKPLKPSSSTPPPRPNPLRYRTIPIIFGGITLFALSGYTTYLYIHLSRGSSAPILTLPSSQPAVFSRYNTIATKFDSMVDWTETLMRLPSLRRKLASQAQGDVLEVSIGTGRNLEYYEWDFKGYNGVGKPAREGGVKRGKVRSFTAVDKSAEMLEVAHERFATLFPGIVGVRWVVGDAEREIPSPPRNANERSGNLEGEKYDTVVQTMGLCSVVDPVGLLRNLGRVVKDDGRILLLEHGRGNWEWLNGILDRFAEEHAREFGCWWNRDLGQIVRESGLEVVKMDTIWWHGGTTWRIELKKPKDEVEEKSQNKKAVTEPVGKEEVRKKS